MKHILFCTNTSTHPMNQDTYGFLGNDTVCSHEVLYPTTKVLSEVLTKDYKLTIKPRSMGHETQKEWVEFLKGFDFKCKVRLTKPSEQFKLWNILKEQDLVIFYYWSTAIV